MEGHFNMDQKKQIFDSCIMPNVFNGSQTRLLIVLQAKKSIVCNNRSNKQNEKIRLAAIRKKIHFKNI